MTLTNGIIYKTLHDDAITKIREGLATICIDPKTSLFPVSMFPDVETAQANLGTLLMSDSEVGEVLQTLARYLTLQGFAFDSQRGVEIQFINE